MTKMMGAEFMSHSRYDTAIKRDLVEHAEAEDGSWWYDLYSGGFIRQGGTVDLPNLEHGMTVTAYFPKSISQMINPNAIPHGSMNDGARVAVKSWTENSITVSVQNEHNYDSQPMKCFWIVEAMV